MWPLINHYLDEMYETPHVLKVYHLFGTFEVRAARVGDEIACGVFRDDEYLDALSLLTTRAPASGSQAESSAISELMVQMRIKLTGYVNGYVYR